MLADDLAAYMHELSYTDLDEETVETVKTRVLDSVGVAFAAWNEEPVQAVLRYAEKHRGETEAAVLGVDKSVSVAAAALANSALIRYLDWNDTYLSKEPAHPSDNLGAILAAASASNASGKDVITATVGAYELQSRLCDAASLRVHGFDHVNYGLVSATLAAAKLMALTKNEMVQAVNIAVNGHVALRQARAGELTEWKGFAFANVCRNAVFACELAAEGVHGPSPIFEGAFGFFNQVTGSFELDTGNFGGNTEDFKINESYIKYYPVEYHAQAAAHLAVTLREEHGIDWERIEAVENETYEAAVSIITEEEEKWDPHTRETADHSMPYIIARALIDGQMGLEQFTLEKVRDPNVRTVMENLTIEENTDYTAVYGEKFPHTMRIRMENGETYEQEMQYPKGHPKNALTREELRAKFDAAAHVLTAEQRDAVFETVETLEQQDSLQPLFDAAVVQ